MTLQIINSTTAGATQDLSTRVFMASERLGLPPFSITQNAEEGSVAHSTLPVDDPSGNLTLKGHRRVYFVETSAPAGQQVIGNTYVGIKTIDRGDWNVGPLARTFSVQLADANTLISRRIMVGSDANRPAETDVQRVQWLLTTTEANEFNGSSLYVNTVGAVNMDAVDYRRQSVEAILSDCARASGKNYWVVYFEALGQFGLWYDWDYSEVYDSTIKLSNDEADIDDSTTFAYFHTSNLTQDPGRVYSGTVIDFQPAASETTSWVYETDIDTGNEFVFRDVAYTEANVKTETKARARARRYNAGSDSEEDVMHVSFVVPAAKVNAFMHGMRIQVKGTHWGFTGGSSYTSFTWTRGLHRTVTQLAPTHYRIDADLSPVPTVTPSAYLWDATTDDDFGAYFAAGIYPIVWSCSGDLDPGLEACHGVYAVSPTTGPLQTTRGTISGGGFGNYLGFTFSGSGTINFTFLYTAYGTGTIPPGRTFTVQILIDGVVVASKATVTTGISGISDTVTGTNIVVGAGSVLTGRMVYTDPGGLGIYLDSDLQSFQITGGSLFAT